MPSITSDIYEAMSLGQPNYSNYQERSVDYKSILKKLLELDFDDNTALEKITKCIQELREDNFNKRYISNEGKTILVKDLRNANIALLDPIDPYEHEINALQYLRGMVLIKQNLGASSANFNAALKKIYKTYIRNILSAKTFQEDHQSRILAIEKYTKQLVGEFSNLIAKELNVDKNKARQQVTMAKDLAILLQTPPTVCTITASNDKTTIELSEPVKISDSFYDENCVLDPALPRWFINAKKSAGFADNQQETWLENFFRNNLDKLKEAGVSAPPSARWLPMPANNQVITTAIMSDMEVGFSSSNSADFIRMGTPIAYNVKSENEQERLVMAQLKEIIRSQIDEKIRQYQDIYGDIRQGKKFFISYQTLLSPHYVESFFYKFHKDNNAKFIEMTKKAIEEIAKNIGENLGIEIDATLDITHTNAAINSKSSWASAKTFTEDNDAKEKKLSATAEMIGGVLLARNDPDKDIICDYIKTGNKSANLIFQDIKEKINNFSFPEEVTPALKAEITMRMQAACHLRSLLNGEIPYRNLEVYQRNIMMAALEFLTMGKQALSLVGCKSARDRTAIFAAAEKTMRENPDAMQNWDQLNMGIITSLKQGHHFRSMIYHTAIVKIGQVHRSFVDAMPEEIRFMIKHIKDFTKKLGTVKKSKAQPNQAFTFFKSRHAPNTPKPVMGIFNESLSSSSEVNKARLKQTSEAIIKEMTDKNDTHFKKLLDQCDYKSLMEYCQQKEAYKSISQITKAIKNNFIDRSVPALTLTILREKFPIVDAYYREKKSFWQKFKDVISNNRVKIGIGIGLAAGIGLGIAAIFFPPVAAIIPFAAVLTSAITGAGGTALLGGIAMTGVIGVVGGLLGSIAGGLGHAEAEIKENRSRVEYKRVEENSPVRGSHRHLARALPPADRPPAAPDSGAAVDGSSKQAAPDSGAVVSSLRNSSSGSDSTAGSPPSPRLK